MFSPNSSDITFSSGSRLLSESLLLPSSHSHTGPGGDDLSLSELSLAYRPTPPPSTSTSFIPDHPSHRDPFDDDHHDYGVDGDHGEPDSPRSLEQTTRDATKTREDKLQRDLFILKKLNSSFALFNDALKDTQTGTEVRLCVTFSCL
jgi:hypothetical protein